MSAGLPIGVFDSGVGGLTVVKALRAALPNESLLYLGDTARLPYGTKSPASVARYACQASTALMQRGVKLLVVACNTASAVALPELRKLFAPVPVVGVVEPGASAAVPFGRRHLVLATEATVRLGAYRQAIHALDSQAEVRELPCELMVALAEEGWTNDEISRGVIARYLSQASDFHPDTIILGCTHFPLLIPAIEAVAEAGVHIVNSASTTATVVAERLTSGDLLADPAGPGELHLCATDGPTRFARVGGHFLGEPLSVTDIEVIDL